MNFATQLLKPQHLVAVCHTCRLKHRMEVLPDRTSNCFNDWQVKHLGHRIEFRRPSRRLADYRHNADIKVAYGSSAALTITLTSLATDANLLAGRESTAIDNSSNKYVDILVGGRITQGTSPTASKSIEVWAYGSVNDTPVYPDSFTASDANKTVSATGIKQSGLALLGILGTSSTSDQVNWLSNRSLANCYGGILPKFWGLFVVHNTGVSLHATGTNHVLSYTPVYFTSI